MPTLSQQAQQMQPIFVVAPTARNGITLIQRLLNSSRQIIVYGENINFVDALPKLVYTSVQTHTRFGQEFNESRDRFLNQTTEYWTSNLWPDTERFMLQMFDAFNRAAVLYQRCSQDYGFERWGIKNPMTCPDMIVRLTALMPQAKFVCIYRNLIDVARSAKARQFIQSPDDFVQLAQLWQENVTALLQTNENYLLVAQYEKLLADPDNMLDRIEAFVGITGIDRTVLGRKINTFDTQSNPGVAQSGYIPPQPLTPDETRLLVTHAKTALDIAGYEANQD